MDSQGWSSGRGIGSAGEVGGLWMRAFRPSYFGAAEEFTFPDPVEDRIRTGKLKVYAKRAEAKMPLFPDEPVLPSPEDQDQGD
jgi:hypothetical protein